MIKYAIIFSANLNLNYNLFIKKHIKKTLIISHALSVKGMGHRWGLDTSNISNAAHLIALVSWCQI